MVGFSHIYFKATYILGHAVQAVIIALANGSKLKVCNVNGVTWQVENHEEPLEHRTRRNHCICLGDKVL